MKKLIVLCGAAIMFMSAFIVCTDYIRECVMMILKYLFPCKVMILAGRLRVYQSRIMLT